MNLATLKPVSSRTPEERRALASKAGRASVKRRRELKASREVMRELLALPLDGERPETAEAVEFLTAQGVKDREQSQLWALLWTMLRRAQLGDVRAAETALKIAGEYPAEKAEIKTTETEPETRYNFIDLTPEQATELVRDYYDKREKDRIAEEEREARREARVKRIAMYKAGIFPPEDEKKTVNRRRSTVKIVNEKS